MEEKSLKQMAGNLNIELGVNYSANVRNIYKRCFKEDHLIVKYFCNIGFFRKIYQALCPKCKKENSREHAIDDCEQFKPQRDELLAELKALDKRLGAMTITKAIEEIYYRPRGVEDKKEKCLEWMRKCITTLYKTR